MDKLYQIFMLVIAVTALAGVFSPVYKDTILQRIGMSLISSGAVLDLVCWYYECGNGRSALVMVGGVALYGTATTIRHWRSARKARLMRKSLRRKT